MELRRLVWVIGAPSFKTRCSKNHNATHIVNTPLRAIRYDPSNWCGMSPSFRKRHKGPPQGVEVAIPYNGRFDYIMTIDYTRRCLHLIRLEDALCHEYHSAT